MLLVTRTADEAHLLRPCRLPAELLLSFCIKVIDLPAFPTGARVAALVLPAFRIEFSFLRLYLLDASSPRGCHAPSSPPFIRAYSMLFAGFTHRPLSCQLSPVSTLLSVDYIGPVPLKNQTKILFLLICYEKKYYYG